MFYIINTYGTTRAVITEPIYQGSVGVNSITLLAPFPSNVIIEVNAILPNGLMIRNLNPLTATIYPEGMPPIFDPNGKPYTTFSGIIDSSLTQQAGIVQIQFKVMLGVGKELGTYMTSFNVSKGVSIESLPEPSADDYYNTILQYLAEIDKDAIKSVIYSDPEYEELPSSVDRGTFPTGFIQATPDGTIANITDNSEPLFIYMPTPFGGEGSLYFSFTYSSTISVELIQLYMMSPTFNDIGIRAVTYVGDNVTGTYNLAVSPTTGEMLINPRIFINGKGVDKIEFSISFPNDPLFIKGIQVFRVSDTGKYEITFESGAQAIINAPSVGIIQNYFENAKDEADRATSQATEAKESAIQSSAAASAANYNAGEAKTYANNASASATEAKESAAQAEASAQEANAALQNILGRRSTFYEATMAMALGAVLNNSYVLASGDLFVIGATGVPDLIVFSATDEPIASATEIITQAQINAGTFNVVSGGRYKLENANGVIQWGVVAIESGFDTTNLVTIQEFNAVIAGLDVAKQNKLPTAPLTVIGVNSTGEIVNYKIAQAAPETETDGDSIVNTAILSQALGNIGTALENIITLQNSYINGGVTQ